ncbi:MAG: methylmalonyl Co-A mutase-associated GTPase MeaB, partial [Anaerolineaceae bacterium]|nr:methylmalonyl Co-A mutase-associated GTPase MeaB [Anaerolineaceae bacterium]
DDIQAIKAGILEIADIMVVNKCDLPGADQTARALKVMLELAHPVRRGRTGAPETINWQAPVILACSTGCQGIDEILDSIRLHMETINRTGERFQRDRERLQNSLEALLRDTLLLDWKNRHEPGVIEKTVSQLASREISPFEAVDRLLEKGPIIQI